jgi:ABC-type uncharacterized transport system involved in gliding motility auxiliary subunit/ABC-type transport system involved in cytochrome c biogenesis permease component
MSRVLVVARRELGAMFRAPLAYVFLILFLVVVTLPHVLTVFAHGQAEAQYFFDFLPWCIVVFSALVTMRSWAEELQDNTYEMLLTFPMKDVELVLGKWIAAFVFLAAGIVGTVTVPIMLFTIGRPDPGPIVAGYVGALLLAATSSAAGVFFSGLTRSQLLAALLSLVFGFLSLLVGIDQVATLADAQLGGFGRVARDMIGAWDHYATFERGVVEAYDVIFFAAWTTLFLHLNTLFLGLRRISGSWPQMLAATLLGFGCGMFTSRLVSEGSLARVDLTQDKLYTLSPGTLAILAQCQVPVQVKYYVSPESEMPSKYKQLERKVVDQLSEMQVASHGKLVFSVLHLNPGNLVPTPAEEAAADDDEGALSLGGDEKDKTKKTADEKKKADDAKKSLAEKEKSVEKRLLDKGVKPFTVQSFEATQVSSKLVYSTIGVAYRERDEEFIPLNEERLPEMEYLLANTVAKIARPRPPRIALVTGEEAVDPQIKMMYQRMGQKIPDPFSRLDDFLRQEKYDVQPVKLTAQSPLPDDYDALVVVGPVSLDERQRWEIGRALYEGKPTLLALQRYTWEYRQQRQQILIQHQDADPGLDDLLAANGLGVSKDFLLDMNKRALSVQTGGFFPTTVDLPMHVLVAKGQMNADSPLTQRLSSILYLWGTSVTLDEPTLAAKDLKRTILLSSSEKSWLVSGGRLSQSDLPSADGRPPEGKEMKPRPLMVEVEGRFTNPDGSKPRPKWTPKVEFGPDGRPIPAMPDKPETPAVAGKGKLILTGCARMWSDALLGAMGDGTLFLNCVDALTLDENLLLVRSKQPTDRSFDKPTATTAAFWTVATLGLVPLLIVVIGVGIAVVRMRRRESWNSSHGRWRS